MDPGPEKREDLEERLVGYERRRAVDPGLAFEVWLAEQPGHLCVALRRAWRALESFDRHPRGFFLSQHRDRPRSSSRAQEGMVLGDYRLLRPLGRGAMGEVWEARQLSLEKPVALKLLWGGDLEETALRRFQAEARAAARVRHPGVVMVQGIGEGEGFHYIAEELIEEGWTLKDFLDEVRRDGNLSADHYREVARLFAEVAEALQAAHEAGVIHRDVKPSNILITPQDRPKVADFGLARLAETSDLSRTGDFVGTYGYMSPEQAMARRIGLDHRTDVFSLGATLYEALTLRRAFEGDTSQQVLESVLYQEPPDPRELRSQVPRDLAVVCTKAIEKQREHRYATMLAMAEDLRRCLAGEPILARPMGPLRRAGRWGRANRRTLAGASTLLAAVLFAVFLRDYSQERRRTERLSDYTRLAGLLDEVRTVRRHDPRALSRLEGLREEAHALLEREGMHRRFQDSLGRAHQPGTVLAKESGLANETASGGSVIPGAPIEPAERWEFETTQKHLQRLEEARKELVRLDGAIAFLHTVEERTVSGPAARIAWKAVCASLGDPERCPKYGGLTIEPQTGLLPLGRDQGSGLWEFLHVQSGEAPLRDPNTGRWRVEPETGIVLVLLPGGRFTLGSDPLQDPEADTDEAPQEVELAPFFLSRFEMTQGQWLRCSGWNRSKYDIEQFPSGDMDSTHPVEYLSWIECRDVLAAIGLCLPTEARWEYGARAGTTTPWSTGASRETLIGTANLADASAGLSFEKASRDWPEFSDGYPVHAPVDALRPNAFGLHHVHGNVTEWTLDHYCVSYREYPDTDPATGERSVPSGQRVVRGGGFDSMASEARSARREFHPEEFRLYSIGLRPARTLEGAWSRR